MAGTTARLSLPYPQLTDAADITNVVQPLATMLDSIMPIYGKGTLAARPAASSHTVGEFYYATDNGITYFCDGVTWQRIDQDAVNRLVTLESEAATQIAINAAARLTALEAKTVECAGMAYVSGTAASIINGTAKYAGLTSLFDSVSGMVDVPNQRLNIKRAGTYRVKLNTGSCVLSTATDFIKLNGATLLTGANSSQERDLTWYYHFNVNDFLEAFYTSTQAQNLSPLLSKLPTAYVLFTAELMGP